MIPPPPRSTLFPYTTLFRSELGGLRLQLALGQVLETRFVRVDRVDDRSEEHTSELQSHHDIVCRLLLEKKNLITAVARFLEHFQLVLGVHALIAELSLLYLQ